MEVVKTEDATTNEATKESRRMTKSETREANKRAQIAAKKEEGTKLAAKYDVN